MRAHLLETRGLQDIYRTVLSEKTIFQTLTVAVGLS